MRVLVVHGQKIEHYPPVRSLIEVLARNNYEVTVVTKGNTSTLGILSNSIKVINISDNDNIRNLSSAIKYIKKKSNMRKIVKREMDECDVLWTTTDSTVRDLGKLVLNYKHVMQLMELIEDMPALPLFKWPRLHIYNYARRAYKVVVPEQNRAHIQRVWWGLEDLPIVLPNKMSSLPKCETSREINQILEQINNDSRKIVLYQGSFDKDRELDKFAEAISSMKQYKLCIMGSDNEYRKELCKKYPDIVYIPFVVPPYHLLITQKAYIGLMPYVPTVVGFNSILNALYCAPNKIYEFTGYGIPMIGNNVPGISIPFETEKIGRVRKENSVEEIIYLIKSIEKDYEELSTNCKKYFQKVDLDEIVKKILQ